MASRVPVVQLVVLHGRWADTGRHRPSSTAFTACCFVHASVRACGIQGEGGGIWWVNVVWDIWRFYLAANCPTPNPFLFCPSIPLCFACSVSHFLFVASAKSPRREVVRSSAGAGVVYPPFLGSFA